MSRVLVAGVGNIFLGDDGFGVEVARRLREDDCSPADDTRGLADDTRGLGEDTRRPGADVTIADFGIRGVHLAYELLNGYDTLVLIDAVSRGDPPGTVSVIEATTGPSGGDGVLVAMDAHGMNPGAVLAMVEDLGGRVGQVLVVGCEAASLDHGIGLSEPVSAALPAALDAVRELIDTLVKEGTP
ncbi:MAG: hydrogenase maturation protease [Acidimicrobiales bacterium]